MGRNGVHNDSPQPPLFPLFSGRPDSQPCRFGQAFARYRKKRNLPADHSVSDCWLPSSLHFPCAGQSARPQPVWLQSKGDRKQSKLCRKKEMNEMSENKCPYYYWDGYNWRCLHCNGNSTLHEYATYCSDASRCHECYYFSHNYR